MTVVQLEQFQPEPGIVFLTVFAVKHGLSEICKQNAIRMTEDIDELGKLRYATIECNGIVAMIENYPKYHPDSFSILLLNNLSEPRAAARRVMAALKLEECDIEYIDGNFMSYPRNGKPREPN